MGSDGSNHAVVSPVVLVVEDEQAIADAMVARLEAEGFSPIRAVDGPSAVEVCGDAKPDLVLLDLNLPGFDGIEVCRRIQADRRVPVIMVTARTEETDLLVGLGVGADDYLMKPFSMKELMARIRALLRRASEASEAAGSEPLVAGALELDPSRRTVRFRGEDVHLTPTEFDLLRALWEADGAVLNRLELLDRVWGYRDGSGARTVDSHIRSVRRKTGDQVIRTVHGVGYSFEAPER